MQNRILCQSRFYMRKKGVGPVNLVIERRLLCREQRILLNYRVFH